VIPKKSLTGDATERVDTRVLQALYRIDGTSSAPFIGQQMDVFIEVTNRSPILDHTP
jgi:HlyD family secretion protein